MKNMTKVVVLVLILTLSLSFYAVAQGNTFARKFELNEMVEYKSFSDYKESPVLSKLVDEGKLISVKDRLPVAPKVIKKAVMPDGPGVYGGVLMGTSAATPQGYNWAAGNNQGWYGIDQILQEGLIELGPNWQLKNPKPLPNLAQSWQWSEDGKTLTMKLIEGAKWSDGVAFNADDVLFTYYDCIINERVPSWRSKGSFTFNGETAELEKIDQYTIRWTFNQEYPIRALYMMGYRNFSIIPKHVFAEYHPDYNEDMDYDDFINAAPMDKLPAVTLSPWVPVNYKPGRLLIMERNPFFWQVDEEGKQLPYIDEVRYEFAKEGTTRTLNVISGKGDITYVENLSNYSLLKKESLKPDAHFKIRNPISFTTGIRMTMNFSLYRGINSERDTAVREMLRNVKFRKAMSHAINRDSLADAALPGPITEPWYGGFPKGSPYFNESSLVKHEYNKEISKQLLTELDFKDTDGDGILNWPEGSVLAGQDLVLNMYTSTENPAVIDTSEQLVGLLGEVGIKINMKTIKSSLETQKRMAGEFDLIVDEVDQLVNPFTSPEYVGVVSHSTPDWHLSGPDSKRDLMGFETDIEELLAQAAVTPSPELRKELFTEILKLATENEYYIGLYQFGYATGIGKRLMNIQPDVVAASGSNYLPNNIPIHQIWTPEDKQIEPWFINLVPVPESY